MNKKKKERKTRSMQRYRKIPQNSSDYKKKKTFHPTTRY